MPIERSKLSGMTHGDAVDGADRVEIAQFRNGRWGTFYAQLTDLFAGIADFPLRGDLANPVTGFGANLVAVEDAAGSFAGDTVEEVLTEIFGNMDPALRADLAAKLTGAGLIGDQAPEAGAATNRTIYDRMREIVTDAEFGAVGDGVTDDAAKLLNAANAAVARGRTLDLNGAKTYAIAVQLSLPAGLRMRTNGAIFRASVTTASNSPLMLFGNECLIDHLKVEVPAGIQRDRVLSVTSSHVQIDRIVINALSQQANTSDNDDAALRVINCTGARLGAIEVTGYDRAVIFKGNTDLRHGVMKITNYVRGVQYEDNVRVRADGASITIASVNALYTPGHVGVLMSAGAADSQRNVKLNDFVIEDSGEHGLRVAGPEQHSNIHINNITTKNTGGSGIKILGQDTAMTPPYKRNKRLFILNPVCEDAGSGGMTDNMCGINIMYASDVQVLNPIVRKSAKLYSGTYGIKVTASEDVHIVNPNVSDAQLDGIYFDASEFDIDRPQITGGTLRSNGRDGLRVACGVNAIRNLQVTGLASINNTGKGFTIAAGGGTMVDGLVSIKTYANAGGAGACDTAAITLDGYGLVGATPLAGIVANNGSRWSDGTTLNIRKAGAWAAL